MPSGRSPETVESLSVSEEPRIFMPLRSVRFRALAAQPTYVAWAQPESLAQFPTPRPDMNADG